MTLRVYLSILIAVLLAGGCKSRAVGSGGTGGQGTGGQGTGGCVGVGNGGSGGDSCVQECCMCTCGPDGERQNAGDPCPAVGTACDQFGATWQSCASECSAECGDC